MARIAATRSIIVFVVVVVSSLFVLSLARHTIDQLPSDAEGSASSLQALASPTLLLTRGESDPSVADQDPDKRADLEAAKPLPAAAEDDDPTALAVADRRPPDADRRLRRFSLSCLLGGCGNEEVEAPRRGGGDAAALPAAAAAAEEEEEEAERAVAGAEANRRSAEAMGWIPKEGDGAKEKEGEKATKKKKKGKKPRDSDSDSDSSSGSDSDSDSDDDDDDEEEDEVEGEGKRKKEKDKKKEKGGFLKWFSRLVNRFF